MTIKNGNGKKIAYLIWAVYSLAVTLGLVVKEFVVPRGNEKSNTEVAERLSRVEDGQNRTGERLARVEEGQARMTASMDRIERKLDSHIERGK